MVAEGREKLVRDVLRLRPPIAIPSARKLEFGFKNFSSNSMVAA
jgi:hypothetical protein